MDAITELDAITGASVYILPAMMRPDLPEGPRGRRGAAPAWCHARLNFRDQRFRSISSSRGVLNFSLKMCSAERGARVGPTLARPSESNGASGANGRTDNLARGAPEKPWGFC